jgi:RNA polymerase sigma-70 factor (ECF subfamily)
METAHTDTALVQAAQRGDRGAFGVLVARHASAVLSVTTRMLGADDAEDAAQDTFVAAFTALAGFKHEARFSTWLYRIAVNKCHDRLRARRGADVSLEEEHDEAGWEPPDDETPHWELEQSEMAEAIERGIQALPPLYRESFVLRHIEGLDYDEMSAILDASRDTVKMRVYKARHLLCRTLAHLSGACR